MACAYISKYVGKVNSINPMLTGFKQWGNSRNLPISASLSIKLNRDKAYNLLELIRCWLVKQGRFQYESNEYFNIYRPQTIFINSDDMNNLLNYLYDMYDDV